ncbi:MAG: hypothetical protein IH892_05585 [Planctomycetes bacterium]|nr:hypothetical protein [Planctomycetota bacterium]
MNRAPVNGPVDDPTCNYNTGRDKPGESVSSSPGQTAIISERTARFNRNDLSRGDSCPCGCIIVPTLLQVPPS